MTRRNLWRLVAATLLLLASVTALGAHPGALARQQATPPAYTCDDVSPADATPSGMDMGGMDMGGMDMGGMDMGSPTAGMAMEMELDQLYIDMMIPHHVSIVALAQAALPRLEDQRLQKIARRIVDAQTAEVEELRGYREDLYGSPEPMPMDAMHMDAMAQAMPGMGSMDEMAFQMDAGAQVAAICAAEDVDLAFIDLTIPHHEMAIVASETAVDQATHEEIRVFAERVIADQQREIDELETIRAELAGDATPEADAHDDHAAQPSTTSEIRALTSEQVAQIERGEGAGLALPAELNGVPGPRHVLDLADELGLTVEQRAGVQRIFDEMKAGALPAGERYLAAQAALEQDLRDGTLTEQTLPGRVAEVSRLQGELAAVHLTAHLRTASILTAEQVVTYEALRQAA